MIKELRPPFIRIPSGRDVTHRVMSWPFGLIGETTHQYREV